MEVREVINHRDGNPANNEITNLEFTQVIVNEEVRWNTNTLTPIPETTVVVTADGNTFYDIRNGAPFDLAEYQRNFELRQRESNQAEHRARQLLKSILTDDQQRIFLLHSYVDVPHRTIPNNVFRVCYERCPTYNVFQVLLSQGQEEIVGSFCFAPRQPDDGCPLMDYFVGQILSLRTNQGHALHKANVGVAIAPVVWRDYPLSLGLSTVRQPDWFDGPVTPPLHPPEITPEMSGYAARQQVILNGHYARLNLINAEHQQRLAAINARYDRHTRILKRIAFGVIGLELAWLGLVAAHVLGLVR